MINYFPENYSIAFACKVLLSYNSLYHRFTNKWCVIRLVTPTTIKYNLGFHVYRTHLLDHYPFLDIITFLLVLWRASLSTSIFYYFFPSNTLLKVLEDFVLVWNNQFGAYKHIFLIHFYFLYDMIYAKLNEISFEDKLLCSCGWTIQNFCLSFSIDYFSQTILAKLCDNISTRTISKQQNV